MKLNLFALPPLKCDYTVFMCSFIHSVTTATTNIYLERETETQRQGKK